MDEQRKKIIVAEIENWRQNQLLPEHYCIFLLNLYTEGDFAQTGGKSKSGKLQSGGTSLYSRGPEDGGISRKWLLIWFLCAFLIGVGILLAFHFNDFPLPMQIGILIASTLIFYLLSFIFKKRSPFLTHTTLAVSFLLMILGGFFLMREAGLPVAGLLLFLALVCLFWMINGSMFGFGYLLYCGMLGLGCLYGFLTTQRLEESYSWWVAELYWVPIALSMVGGGFLLHQRHGKMAGALAICGMLFFFGPEITSLYVQQARYDLIQLLLFSKVLIASLLFFLTRRYWFQWFRL